MIFGDNFPNVSIVIPHYNNVSGLQKCIDAIKRSDYPPEKLEIIIVDNGSATDQRQQLQTLFPLARIADEPKPGSYAARNTGVELSTAEVIAFTDSDCIPDPSWITSAVNTLRKQNEPTIIAGDIHMALDGGKNWNRYALYERITALNQKKFVQVYSFGATANLIVPKCVLEMAGLFNESLKSGGDREWCLRAQIAGAKLLFEPCAIIQHGVRTTKEELENRVRRVTGGIWELRKQPHAQQTQSESLLKRLRRIHQTGALQSPTDLIQFLVVCCEVKIWQITEKRRLSKGTHNPIR